MNTEVVMLTGLMEEPELTVEAQKRRQVDTDIVLARFKSMFPDIKSYKMGYNQIEDYYAFAFKTALGETKKIVIKIEPVKGNYGEEDSNVN